MSDFRDLADIPSANDGRVPTDSLPFLLRINSGEQKSGITEWVDSSGRTLGLTGGTSADTPLHGNFEKNRKVKEMDLAGQ